MGSKVLEGGGVRLGRGWLRKRRRGCNYFVPFCSCDVNREEGRGEVYGRGSRSGERGREWRRSKNECNELVIHIGERQQMSDTILHPRTSPQDELALRPHISHISYQRQNGLKRTRNRRATSSTDSRWEI
jgi:hypothetical protein